MVPRLPRALLFAALALTIASGLTAQTLSIGDASITEGQSGYPFAYLTVTLSAPVSYGFDVNFTFAGTATRSIDYIPLESVYFPAGDTNKTLAIQVNGDMQVEPNETVVVTMSSITPFGSGPLPTFAKRIGTLTIVNDDYDMPWAKFAAGTTGRMSIHAGNPAAAQDTISLTSSRPDIAKVPATLIAQAGRSTFDFEVQALVPGTSMITARLPASLGGATLAANVDFYTAVKLTIQPQAVVIPTYATAVLKLTLSPAPVAPVDLKVTTPTPTLMQIPATVHIDTTGSGTLSIWALRDGLTSVTVTLPAANGGFETVIPVTISGSPSGLFVTDVSPQSGPTAGGTETAVTGLHFVAPCTVKFGGNIASDVDIVVPTYLFATTPPHPAGTVDVEVACGTEHASLANAFTYVPATPRLNYVLPNSGTSRGGTLVTILGTNLRSSCGVTFGGTTAKIVGDSTPESFVVAAPPHDPGVVDVLLQCSDTSASFLSAFTYTAADEPSAAVNGIDPAAASPGASVTISGSRFRASDTITFGGVRASVIATTPGFRFAVVPNLSPGRVPFVLTDADGHTSTTDFTVLPAVTPEITSVTPTRAAPGGEIVISGRGFRAPYTFALDDGSAGMLVEIAFDRAVVRLDRALTAGSYTLGVLNADKTIAATGPKIDIAPTIAASAVSPICATAAGGIDVTITGIGFEPGAQVTFGVAAATNVRVIDSQTIEATVPEGHIGWPTVTITNANGLATTLTRGFFYYSPYDPDAGCASTRTRGVRH